MLPLATTSTNEMTETPFPDEMVPRFNLQSTSSSRVSTQAITTSPVSAKCAAQVTIIRLPPPRPPLPEVKVDPRAVMLSHYGMKFLSVITPDILWSLPDATIRINKTPKGPKGSFVAKELFIPSEMPAPAVRGLTNEWQSFVAINLTWCNSHGRRVQVVESVLVDKSRNVFFRQTNLNPSEEDIPSFLHNDLTRLKELLQGKTLSTDRTGRHSGTVRMEQFIPALAPSMSVDGAPMQELISKKKMSSNFR